MPLPDNWSRILEKRVFVTSPCHDPTQLAIDILSRGPSQIVRFIDLQLGRQSGVARKAQYWAEQFRTAYRAKLFRETGRTPIPPQILAFGHDDDLTAMHELRDMGVAVFDPLCSTDPRFDNAADYLKQLQENLPDSDLFSYSQRDFERDMTPWQTAEAKRRKELEAAAHKQEAVSEDYADELAFQTLIGKRKLSAQKYEPSL